MEFKYIGKPILRPDAVSKATGKAVYVDDIRIPGMLHAAIKRPEEYAHAKILSIDTTEAEQMPGVVVVVTGKGCKLHYGDNIADISPMAVEKVRYGGEPVAAVVAETAAQAQAAVEKIKVEYEPLPIYTDAREAMKPDAMLIHEHPEEYWRLPSMKYIPDTNVANYYRLIKGKGQEGFEDADVVIEGEFLYPFGSSAAIEPHGSIVWFKEDNYNRSVVLIDLSVHHSPGSGASLQLAGFRCACSHPRQLADVSVTSRISPSSKRLPGLPVLCPADR